MRCSVPGWRWRGLTFCLMKHPKISPQGSFWARPGGGMGGERIARCLICPFVPGGESVPLPLSSASQHPPASLLFPRSCKTSSRTSIYFPARKLWQRFLLPPPRHPLRLVAQPLATTLGRQPGAPRGAQSCGAHLPRLTCTLKCHPGTAARGTWPGRGTQPGQRTQPGWGTWPGRALPFSFPHGEPHHSQLCLALVPELSPAACQQPPNDGEGPAGCHPLPKSFICVLWDAGTWRPAAGWWWGPHRPHTWAASGWRGKKGLSGGGRNQRITGLLPDCPICHQHKDKPRLGLGCQRGAHHYIRTPLGEAGGGKWQLSGRYHFSCNSSRSLLHCT